MDDSEIAAIRSVFEIASGHSETATLVVAVGVVIDLMVLMIFSRDMNRLEKALLFLANILIVGGCVGEWIYGGRASVAATRLQQISDEKVAESNKRSKEAEANAKHIELELEKLRATRHISAWDHASLASELRKFANINFDVSVKQGDNEAVTLLGEIESLLSDADWNQENWGATIILMRPNKPNLGPNAGIGVVAQIAESDRNTLWDAANALSSGLLNVKIAAKAEVAPDEAITSATKHAIHIFVGEKPLE